MDLDDLNFIRHHDPHGMLTEIDNLPEQLQSAWELGGRLPLDEFKTLSGINRVLITGMGGSAIGADLLAAYASATCRSPIVVYRDYGLPAWANGPETLVIASSHSGNTEETLDSFETALNQDCRILAISTGGKLAQRAAEAGTPVWLFEHAGQPRAAVGFSFGLLLAALARLGLIPDPGQELLDAIAAMHGRQDGLRADTPTAENPAKRMAGQLVGYWVNVYGAGFLAPVARRWKGQINELAKAGAGFELLPEADHNMLAGIHFPEKALSRIFQLFLGAPSLHPRNRLRLERTRQAMMVEGLNTDHYEAYGASALAQMWNAIHFGDYTAFYLAMEYGIDPWDTSMLEQFKNSMRTGD